MIRFVRKFEVFRQSDVKYMKNKNFEAQIFQLTKTLQQALRLSTTGISLILHIHYQCLFLGF